MKTMRRRPLHYVIRNLAGIELTPEAIAEITHLKQCVQSEYRGRYYYYFNTCEDYCVKEERAFDNYEPLLTFILQLNPDPQKTDTVEEILILQQKVRKSVSIIHKNELSSAEYENRKRHHQAMSSLCSDLK